MGISAARTEPAVPEAPRAQAGEEPPRCHPGAALRGTLGQSPRPTRTAAIHPPWPQSFERVLPVKAAPIAGLFNPGKRAMAEPGSTGRHGRPAPLTKAPGPAGAGRGCGLEGPRSAALGSQTSGAGGKGGTGQTHSCAGAPPVPGRKRTQEKKG